MEDGGVVAGCQRAGAAVVLPELLPEHSVELVGCGDGLLAMHAVVGHEQQRRSLLGDVHQLEDHVVARNQLAQADEHVGIEDIVGGCGLALIEDAEQVADVIVGHDPLARHGDTSGLPVVARLRQEPRPRHTRKRVRASTCAGCRIPIGRPSEHRRMTNRSMEVIMIHSLAHPFARSHNDRSRPGARHCRQGRRDARARRPGR